MRVSTLCVTLVMMPIATAFFSKQPIPVDSETAHYAIQDMILKYRNLTDPEERKISLFKTKSEFVSNSCIKDAITPILSQCLKKSVNDIDLKLRSRTAARLSICEFEVAAIEYPEECHSYSTSSYRNDEDMDDCVVAMERRSQWWTSYSGYYRSIGEICHQESLSFEKESIMNMFLDVTEHYGKILEFLKEYSTASETFKEESSQSFTKLMNFMNDLNTNTEKSSKQFDQIWEIVRKELFKVSEISSNVTELAIRQTGQLEMNLMDLFKHVNEEYDDNLKVLKEKFVHDIQKRDEMILRSLEATRIGLAELNLLNIENNEMSFKVNKHLKSSINNAANLEESLLTMNETTFELIEEINIAKDVMVDVSDILQSNPFLRILMNATQHLSRTIPMVFLFSSTTSLCFFCLCCFNTISLFRYIGILVLSAVGGFCLMLSFLKLKGGGASL